MVSLLIVRPHEDSIRTRVLALLEKAGLSTQNPQVVPPGTSDDEVLLAVTRLAPSALLIPLHAHHDADKRLVNGLTVAQRIEHECPALARCPIFVPTTPMGMATLELALARPPGEGGLSEGLEARLLPLPIDELESPELLSRTREHLGRFPAL